MGADRRPDSLIFHFVVHPDLCRRSTSVFDSGRGVDLIRFLRVAFSNKIDPQHENRLLEVYDCKVKESVIKKVGLTMQRVPHIDKSHKVIPSGGAGAPRPAAPPPPTEADAHRRALHYRADTVAVARLADDLS
ncbi:hypothetical protein EVAR_29663_1 [Eumeta japonica]|uniref:Uncharacterized protein n=1 Tax=Eumeta variegata TaxID=151549 RepID=A0A4C1W830_EUMVA|nr:hypothetical protein EVAR_29663_1 [Eumeta japonica]